MPNSPLDGSFESSKKRLKPKWVVALIALIATGVGGGVFAISIGINSGGDVEFGQGVAGIMACDETVTLTPVAAYNGGTESFTLSEVVLSGVDDNDNCDGKTITVGVYASAASTPLEEWSTTGASAQPDHTFTSVANPAANDVFNITIESN
jgi:hypothetical protein